MSWHIPKTVRGYQFGEVASALQKSIRRGWEDQALYWAAELDLSGYGKYCWYRLLVITSEDVGLAEPHLPADMWALHSIWSELRKKKKASAPERLCLVHAVLRLVRAKKSRIVDNAMWIQYGTDDRLYEIPDIALDAHTLRGRALGRGGESMRRESYHLENEHPELPNPYAERAGTVAVGQFSRGDALPVGDSEIAFEVLDRALSTNDPNTTTLND